jgi:hypothetical protein
MLEVVEGGLCLLEVWEVLEVPEVMCCVPLCMLEAVEGGLCLPEVMRPQRMLLCIQAVEGGASLGVSIVAVFSLQCANPSIDCTTSQRSLLGVW